MHKKIIFIKQKLTVMAKYDDKCIFFRHNDECLAREQLFFFFLDYFIHVDLKLLVLLLLNFAGGDKQINTTSKSAPILKKRISCCKLSMSFICLVEIEHLN